MSKRELLVYVLLNVALHLVRRWYVYATFLVLFLAPFPLVFAIALAWLVYFCYRLRKG